MKDIEQKVRNEIKDIIDDDVGQISLENLKKMDYMRYVQSEILRMKPPAGLTILRQALADHKIGEISVKKGSKVTI